MKRLLLTSLALVLLTLLLLSGWLLGSESGLRFAYRQIQPTLPGELRLQQVSGTIAGGINLRGIQFIDSEFEADIDQLSFQWNPWALVRYRLEISALDIGQLDLKISTTDSGAPEDSAGINLPQLQLPLSLQLQRLSIDNIQLQQGELSQQLQQLVLQLEGDQSQLQINRLELRVSEVPISENDQIDIDISLSGRIETRADYRHVLRIDWQTSLPRDLALTSSTQLDGDLKSTQLLQQLQQPLQAQLLLDLQDPLQELRWQANLQVGEFDPGMFKLDLPLQRSSINLSAEGDLHSATASGRIDVDHAELGKLSSVFQLSSLEPSRLFEGLQLDSFKLALAEGEGEIDGRGKLYWAPALHWQSDLGFTHINPALLLPEWHGDLNARLTSEGRFEESELHASINITDSSGSLRDYPFALQGIAHWQGDRAEIDSLSVTSGNTRILASGRLGESFDLQWSINSGDLGELYPQAQGQLQASGDLQGSAGAPMIEARFKGAGMEFDDYAIASIDGDISLDLQDWQRLDISLVAQDLDLQGQLLQSVKIVADEGRIDAGLVAEQVSVQLTLKGELQDQSWQGKLLAADIDSTDYSRWHLHSPVALDLSADSISSETLCLISIEQAEVCGSTQSGNEGRDIDLVLKKLPLPLFQQWTPEGLQLDGSVDAIADLQYSAAGSLLGKLDMTLPAGSASYPLQAESVERFDYRQGRLELSVEPDGIKSNVSVTLQNGDRLLASVEMPGASIFEFDRENQPIQGSASINASNWAIVDAMIPQVSGLRGELEVDLKAGGSLARPRLEGSAQFKDGAAYLQEQQMELTEIVITANSSGSENLEFDASAGFAGGRISLRGNTLLQQQENWPSRIQVDATGLQAQQLLAPWIEPPLIIDGLVDATANLEYRAPDRLLGTIKVELPRGSLNYPLVEQEKESWDYRDGLVSLTLEEPGISATGAILIGPHSEFSTEVSLAGARLLALDLDKQAIQAQANIKFDELELLEFLVPDIDQVKGQLLLDINASGSLTDPLINARAQIPQGSFRVPRLGLQISQLELQGSSSDDLGRFNFDLAANSGDGELTISGSSHLSPSQGWPTSITIKGRDFEVSRIPEALVTVSPDLQIELQQRSVTITGDLLIPQAKLQPRDLSTAARVSNDTVIIGGEQIPEEKWLVTTRVNLSLGEKVSFFGFGFEGRLGGNLLVEDVPGQLSIGTGEITIIEGRYRAYGQRLDINNGRLLFTGSALDNPGLDMRAIREIKEVTVGLQLQGRLQQPKLELFSNPSMGETDMLSYLLFGRPMEGATGTEGEMMAKAALALGLAGGDGLARQLGDQFGFDEMRVESDSTGDQASLVIGRYLAPKLYVSYGVGLVESVNKVNIRYELTDRWKLEAESGVHQGADLLYSIER